MKKIFFMFFASFHVAMFSHTPNVFAQASAILWDGDPSGSIDMTNDNNSDALVGILSLIQGILLRVVLPLVAIGVMIYVAYELLTAEGDDEKLKNAWKSIVYGSVAILCILLSSYIVRLIAGLNF